MNYIKDNNYDFCLAGACYPEGHTECDTLYEDLLNLKKKQDSGAEFLITQVFYDNNYFYRLIREARKIGITVPIIRNGSLAISSVTMHSKAVRTPMTCRLHSTWRTGRRPRLTRSCWTSTVRNIKVSRVVT